MAKKGLMTMFPCFLMMVTGCQDDQASEVKESEQIQDKPGTERQELSTNFPPVGTAEVKAFSLPHGVSNFLVDGKLNPEIDPSQGVVLSGALLEEAHAALNAPIDHEMNFMCWGPRDALIFYDAADEVVGSVIICFTCYKVKIRPYELAKNMDYGLLAKVFAHPDLKGGYPFEKKGVSDFVSGYREDLTKSLERRAKSAGRTVIPEPWTVAKPKDEVKIQPGDEVFVSAISKMRFDPCCGKSKVDLKGDLTPLCCSRSVNVGGMTEVEASRVVKELFVQNEIYHPSTEVKVVNANRFPDEK
jgi:hypothetical protein